MRYFDASALVKRYVREQGSAKVRRLLDSDTRATSRLSEVEVTSALMRRAREGEVSKRATDRAVAGLRTDMSAMLVVELTPQIVTLAGALLRRHSLRAGDAIQLASCLFLRREIGDELEFVVFDARLIAAAKREGLAA